MFNFFTRLIVSPLDERRPFIPLFPKIFWRVVEPFSYTTLAGAEFKVPQDFATDFASIPRIFWPVLPPYGQYGKAAVIHDYLYEAKPVSRRQADDIFLEAMARLAVKKWQRTVIYWAVRIFGGLSYSRIVTAERVAKFKAVQAKMSEQQAAP